MVRVVMLEHKVKGHNLRNRGHTVYGLCKVDEEGL